MSNQTSVTSGDLGVSNAQATTGRTILTGVNIFAAAATVAVILYNNTAASGAKVFQYDLVFDADAIGKSMYFALPDVMCKNGIWGVVTGTGAVVILHYR
jgi:hypothetical protein